MSHSTEPKAYFLGPQSENAQWLENMMVRIVSHHILWRKRQFPQDGTIITEQDKQDPAMLASQQRLGDLLYELLHRFEQETPKFTPRYIGHMVSEISMPALLGHIICLLHNPNNASPEVAKVGIQIENEAIGFLLEMLGYSAKHGRGHFTSGGTIANFEALWRARYRLDHWLAMGSAARLKGDSTLDIFQAAHMGWNRFNEFRMRLMPTDSELESQSFVINGPWQMQSLYSKSFNESFNGPVVLVPGSKHYSWQKGVSLLGLGDMSFWPIPLDDNGRSDVGALEALIRKAQEQKRPILMIVSVAGTTELGEIDPICEVQNLLDDLKKSEGLHIWHHIDAAYGGFYCSLLRSPNADGLLTDSVKQNLEAISRTESVTLDPHKLGYVPYSCGAILLRDSQCNRVSYFKAPYLPTPTEGDLNWSSTLEGSRPASGATATWLTAKAIGLNSKGYGRILSTGILAQERLRKLLEEQIPNCHLLDSETNIVCFCIAKPGESVSLVNERTLNLHKVIKEGPNFGVSKTALDSSNYKGLVNKTVMSWQGVLDIDHLVLVRLVLMNPFILTENGQKDYLQGFVDELLSLIQD